jgi:hypothetical protein
MWSLCHGKSEVTFEVNFHHLIVEAGSYFIDSHCCPKLAFRNYSVILIASNCLHISATWLKKQKKYKIIKRGVWPQKLRLWFFLPSSKSSSSSSRSCQHLVVRSRYQNFHTASVTEKAQQWWCIVNSYTSISFHWWEEFKFQGQWNDCPSCARCATNFKYDALLSQSAVRSTSQQLF